MTKIFISYRREDSKHAVGRLHAALKRHVRNPKRDIFIDIDNIPRGVDFVDHLDGQVAQCDVMLAVIGRDWISVRDPKSGGRRLDDPADFVRIELASALKRGIPVVPVVLDDTDIPAAVDLPDDLKLLARRNGERLEHESFDADVERLIRNLPDTKPKAAPVQRASSKASSRSAPGSGGNASWIGPVVALSLVVLGGGAFAWFGNPGDWRGLGAATPDAQPPVSEPVQVAAADPAPAAADNTSPSPAVPVDELAARSAAVRRIQQSLKTLGQYSGSADGATGSATRSAAQAFATAQKIASPDLAAAPVADVEALAARAEQAALVWTTQEAATWRVAKDADTRAPLDAYLRDFPNGPNAAAARSRIASLTRSAAPAPAASVSTPSASSRSDVETFRDCSDCPQMVSIPAGSFMMGSPDSELGRDKDEGPQRRVTVPAFAAGKYEITWAEWDRCVSAGSCASVKMDGFGGGSRPVTNVSWDEAVTYTKWLSNKTGKNFRLLSEAEWEYAARAGTTTPFSFGNTITTSQANYDGNDIYGDGSKGESRQKTTPAGTFSANAFGLHDMHGNVYEWVQDCHSSYYTAPKTGAEAVCFGVDSQIRVVRGGSWFVNPGNLRSAFRHRYSITFRSDGLGFRVARTL